LARLRHAPSRGRSSSGSRVGGAFLVTTGADTTVDTTPDAFAFATVSNAAQSTSVESNLVTITGINTSTPVSISNGLYRIGAGAYTSAPGTINAGQTVQVKVTSAAAPHTAVHATVKVGTVTQNFVVSTSK
jgi:hypothetical protein